MPDVHWRRHISIIKLQLNFYHNKEKGARLNVDLRFQCPCSITLHAWYLVTKLVFIIAFTYKIFLHDLSFIYLSRAFYVNQHLLTFSFIQSSVKYTRDNHSRWTKTIWQCNMKYSLSRAILYEATRITSLPWHQLLFPILTACWYLNRRIVCVLA